MLFIRRRHGLDATDKGWRGTPFYWPVIHDQARIPTAIYTAETIDWDRLMPRKKSLLGPDRRDHDDVRTFT